MQNDLEEMTENGETGQKEEKGDLGPAPSADLAVPEGGDGPEAGEGDEREALDQPEESEAGQELTRMRQGGEEEQDADQAVRLPEGEETEASQPEILIDIEAEENKAAQAERKARLEKERLERSRRLQQYHQDQYAREQYYRGQDAGGTAHTVDGLTVYEDESAVSGQERYGHAIGGNGKPDAVPVRSRERKAEPGQEKGRAAGIDEPEGRTTEPAGKRPVSQADNKGPAKTSLEKKAAEGDIPAGGTGKKAAAGPQAGQGIIERYGLTDACRRGENIPAVSAGSSQGILGPNETAAGIGPAGHEDPVGRAAVHTREQGKPGAYTAGGIRKAERVTAPGVPEAAGVLQAAGKREIGPVRERMRACPEEAGSLVSMQKRRQRSSLPGWKRDRQGPPAYVACSFPRQQHRAGPPRFLQS